jgi:hypothetical protein
MHVSSSGLQHPWPTLYDAWADRSRAHATFLLASHGINTDGTFHTAMFLLKDLVFRCSMAGENQGKFAKIEGVVVSMDYSESPLPETRYGDRCRLLCRAVSDPREAERP